MRVPIGLMLLLLATTGAQGVNERERSGATICVDFDNDNNCGEGNGGGSGGFSNGGGLLHSFPRQGGGGGGGTSGGKTDANGGQAGFWSYSGSSNAPASSYKYQYNQIRGTTAAQLNNALTSYLPDRRVAQTGYLTHPYIHRYQTKWVGDRVGIAQVDIRETVVTVLPEWNVKDQEQAPNCLQAQWTSFIKGAIAHERHHAEAHLRLEQRVKAKLHDFSTATVAEVGLAFEGLIEGTRAEIKAEEEAWHDDLDTQGTAFVDCVD